MAGSDQQETISDDTPREVEEAFDFSNFPYSIHLKRIQAHVISRIGDLHRLDEDQPNQDSWVALHKEHSQSGTHGVVLGVFDGHGDHGEEVSKFVSQSLSELLLDNIFSALFRDSEHQQQQQQQQQPANCDDRTKSIVAKAITDAFHEVEAKLLNSPLGKPNGCTATVSVLLLLGQQLHAWVASCGDSDALLFTCDSTTNSNNDNMTIIRSARPITTTHRPDNPIEKQRILSFGGRYEIDDDYLIDAYDPNKAIAITRCFGDAELKLPHPHHHQQQQHEQQLATNSALICTPDIQYLDLNKDSGSNNIGSPSFVLLMATDGFWDCVTSKEKVLDDIATPPPAAVAADVLRDPKTICDTLLQRLFDRKEDVLRRSDYDGSLTDDELILASTIGSDDTTIMAICIL